MTEGGLTHYTVVLVGFLNVTHLSLSGKTWLTVNYLHDRDGSLDNRNEITGEFSF